MTHRCWPWPLARCGVLGVLASLPHLAGSSAPVHHERLSFPFHNVPPFLHFAATLCNSVWGRPAPSSTPPPLVIQDVPLLDEVWFDCHYEWATTVGLLLADTFFYPNVKKTQQVCVLSEWSAIKTHTKEIFFCHTQASGSGPVIGKLSG